MTPVTNAPVAALGSPAQPLPGWLLAVYVFVPIYGSIALVRLSFTAEPSRQRSQARAALFCHGLVTMVGTCVMLVAGVLAFGIGQTVLDVKQAPPKPW